MRREIKYQLALWVGMKIEEFSKPPTHSHSRRAFLDNLACPGAENWQNDRLILDPALRSRQQAQWKSALGDASLENHGT